MHSDKPFGLRKGMCVFGSGSVKRIAYILVRASHETIIFLILDIYDW